MKINPYCLLSRYRCMMLVMGLVQVCGRCNKEMHLVEGSTIFGDKWYHKDCWESITKIEECKQ